MEIRLHGRGGQGGVSCAKILAALYARLGRSVQAFGDYAGERSGAPVRAYTRVDERPITNRNKIYRPDHLLMLDASLLGSDTVTGLAPGGTLLINSADPPEAFAGAYGAYRIATVDATAIARRHKIGTRSVVIVNTTIAGAFARVLDLPLGILEETYRALGLLGNFQAAREAHEAVTVRAGNGGGPAQAAPDDASPARKAVLPLPEHGESLPTGLQTGAWRSQKPRYLRRLAPCNAGCPAGNDVVGFVQALAKDGTEAAAEVLGRSTPLAAVCGRVCPAPCMEGCNRRRLDGAVNIRGLERWIADRRPVARKAAGPCERPRRVAIVGGGPAGLGAAYTLGVLGHRATVLEGAQALGGLLRTGIPPYRLPRGVLDREVGDIVRLGVEVRCGAVVDRASLKGLVGDYDAVILATGLQRLRSLDVPGTGLDGIEQGIGFLRRVNMGARTRLKGHVFVLGGGNTAMDCARSALRVGASRVTVAYRRTRTEMPAIAEEIEEAEREGVRFLFQRQPVAFRGPKRVRGIVLAEVEMGPPDASGRRRPGITARRRRMPCSAVLLALGQLPDASLLPEGWEIRDGRVFDGGTPLNVFAAGDLATGDGTVAHAIGSGRRAAGLALAALGEGVDVFRRPDRALAVPVDDIRLGYFARAEPARDRMKPAETRIRNFGEASRGLADGLEAHRCFSCGNCTACDACLVYCPEGIIRRERGGYDIDYSYCKGCGICVTECPREAMIMEAL